MLKKVLALVLAGAMVIGSALPAMAETTTTNGQTQKDGKITIDSPIMGASYDAYQIFKMTMNADGSSLAYTIDTDSPFYPAVEAYANEHANGLKLTKIETESVADDAATTEVDESYDKYYISVYEEADTTAGYGAFDAQTFGRAMEAAITGKLRKNVNGKDEIEDYPENLVIAEADLAGYKYAPNYETGQSVVTVATSGELVFDKGLADGSKLPLGYYLITATYPTKSTDGTVTLGKDETYEKTFKVTPDTEAGETEDLVKVDGDIKKDADGNYVYELTDDAKQKIKDYVDAVITNDYVDEYVTDRGLKHIDGTALTPEEKYTDNDSIMAQLKASLTEDATNQVLQTLKNAVEGSIAEINVKEPVLVFLDSTNNEVTIKEKNEIPKWDEPVNPEGSADYKDIPDHDEPEGGKNIVVMEADDPNNTEGKPVYGNTAEANIGESVHYQLRVNAMNFVRESDGTDETINQAKEYFLADYQSSYMSYDASKGIKVSIWQKDKVSGTETNVTKKVTYNEDGTATIAAAQSLDYDSKWEDFFLNDNDVDLTTVPTDIFKDPVSQENLANGKGIMIPFVFVDGPIAEGTTYEPKADYPIYTVSTVQKTEKVGEEEVLLYKTEAIATVTDPDTNVTSQVTIKENGNDVPNRFLGVQDHVVSTAAITGAKALATDGEGNPTEGYLIDSAGNPIPVTEDYYVYSIYNSDVTIVVDYYMILDDDAVVDEPGNTNYAQFAYTPVERDSKTGEPTVIPSNPDEEKDEPSEKKEVDEATVYTYAIAWVKINDKAESLAGATFQLPFYVKYKTTTTTTPAEEEGGTPTTTTTLDKDSNGKPIYDKDGKAYIYGVSNEDYAKLDETEKTFYTNLVTTSTADADGEKGVITIKGVEQKVYTITETEAPVGYNKLTQPFQVEAKKSGQGATVKTETIIYLDANGNVTATETSQTVIKNTDEDSYNKDGTADTSGEESVPVYQFLPVVNNQGTELPSTGGIGTTIFYAGGAILVLLAGVLLVSKRRFA